jgi:hypothetical protein
MLELLKIHRSRISLTRARAGYDYPTIRLPFAFSRLIGPSTQICQTVHDGALAFLVVVSPASFGVSSPNKCEKPIFERRCSTPSHGGGREFDSL